MRDEGSSSGTLGRLGIWVGAGAAIAFALVSLRYLGMYFRPDLFPAATATYRVMPQAVLFFGHMLGGSLAMLVGVKLLISPNPFEEQKPWTRLFIGLAAIAGLFGLYYPLERDVFDVSSYIMLTIAGLFYLSIVQAWRHAGRGDDTTHRRWMALLFCLSFGAAIWRMLYLALAGPQLDKYLSPERTESISGTDAYHSAWYLSLMISLLLAAVLVRRIHPQPSSQELVIGSLESDRH